MRRWPRRRGPGGPLEPAVQLSARSLTWASGRAPKANGVLKMKYVKPWVLRVTAIVALLCILTWLGSLVVAYWGDEYASPPWDERSVPAPRTY